MRAAKGNLARAPAAHQGQTVNFPVRIGSNHLNLMAALAQAQSQSYDVAAHATGSIQVIGADQGDLQVFSQGDGFG